ncbi:MAG: SDR family oxidoreductase [Gammaproteobacteria bacterium]|jgi:3-oxoacyl-[acyl-carrier protein] reductase|nr:SDR family oxidoreductase [Gammaproteobacteria bacterium]
MRFKEKSVIVTGGASGIGRAIAEQFAQEGATVVVADINRESTQDAVEAISARGGRALPVNVDVSNPKSVQEMVDTTVDANGRLDIIVNSAAVPSVSKIIDISFETWNKVININLTGTFLCAQAAARCMVDAGSGRIINLASVNGQRAITGRGAYTAAKGGVIMLTRIMAAELGPENITVNAIAPGPVDTAMVEEMHTAATREAWYRALPIKRYAKPQEVADATLFLASDEARYITGHVLNVDGGFDATGLLFEL